MILALILGLTLAADSPPKAGAGPLTEDGKRAPAPVKGEKQLPDPKPPPQKAADADEEVIRNLDLLERLPLLEKLELFDSSGDSPEKK